MLEIISIEAVHQVLSHEAGVDFMYLLIVCGLSLLPSLIVVHNACDCTHHVHHQWHISQYIHVIAFTIKWHIL